MLTSNDDENYSVSIDEVVANTDVDSLYKMFDGDNNTYGIFKKHGSKYPTVTLSLKNIKFKVQSIFIDFQSTDGTSISSWQFKIQSDNEWIELNSDNSELIEHYKSGYKAKYELKLLQPIEISGFSIKNTHCRYETGTFCIYDVYFEGYKIE